MEKRPNTPVTRILLTETAGNRRPYPVDAWPVQIPAPSVKTRPSRRWRARRHPVGIEVEHRSFYTERKGTEDISLGISAPGPAFIVAGAGEHVMAAQRITTSSPARARGKAHRGARCDAMHRLVARRSRVGWSSEVQPFPNRFLRSRVRPAHRSAGSRPRTRGSRSLRRPLSGRVKDRLTIPRGHSLAGSSSDCASRARWRSGRKSC